MTDITPGVVEGSYPPDLRLYPRGVSSGTPGGYPLHGFLLRPGFNELPYIIVGKPLEGFPTVKARLERAD